MRTGRSVRRVSVGIGGVLPLIAALMVGVPSSVRAEQGTQSDLSDISSGEKKGRVIIAPNSSGQGVFKAEVTVNVHDVEPNTIYQVWRAIDLIPDGVFDPTAPGFPWVEVAAFTTSPGSAGEAHFIRSGGPLSGVRFDVLLQVRLNDGLTVILQSNTMTVTVK
jgi:hypothetical protein